MNFLLTVALLFIGSVLAQNEFNKGTNNVELLVTRWCPPMVCDFVSPNYQFPERQIRAKAKPMGISNPLLRMFQTTFRAQQRGGRVFNDVRIWRANLHSWRTFSFASKAHPMEELANLLPGYRTPCLKSGSVEPERKEGFALRLYGMRFCSDVYKVMLTLAVKKIPCEIVNININDKPEWFVSDKNPSGTVPVLEIDGTHRIRDASIITEYLDDTYAGEPKLIPTDPLEKAQAKHLITDLCRLDLFRKWQRHKDDIDATERLVNLLKLYDQTLDNNENTYISGAHMGWIDVMCWPFLERVSGYGQLGYAELFVTDEKYPKLSPYLRRMRAKAEVKFLQKPAKIYAEYSQVYHADKPETFLDLNFDYGLDNM